MDSKSSTNSRRLTAEAYRSFSEVLRSEVCVRCITTIKVNRGRHLMIDVNTFTGPCDCHDLSVGKDGKWGLS